jgi:hypothetical protein
MVFDDTIPSFCGERLVKCDWSEFNPDATEAIPQNKKTSDLVHRAAAFFMT